MRGLIKQNNRKINKVAKSKLSHVTMGKTVVRHIENPRVLGKTFCGKGAKLVNPDKLLICATCYHKEKHFNVS